MDIYVRNDKNGESTCTHSLCRHTFFSAITASRIFEYVTAAICAVWAACQAPSGWVGSLYFQVSPGMFWWLPTSST